MLGGGSYDYHEGETYYDLGEYTSMLADGTWEGGNVRNMGYVDSTGVGNDAGVSDSIGISDYETVDNNADALRHYFHGNGEAVNIGDNSTLAALSNEDFLNAHEIINSGGNFENNQFGIDMTDDIFHIGNTTVSYKEEEYIEYTFLKGDGFWDPNFVGEDYFGIEPDGIGGNLEVPGGTGYFYNSVTVKIYRY